jgi:tetratricopeptide (TPR) repeat protein
VTTEPPPVLAEAIARYDDGDYDGCRALLDEARRRSGTAISAQVLLFEGLCERRASNLERALELLREALERAPDQPVVLFELGLALIQAGNAQEGLDMLREAVRASGEHPPYRHEFYLQNAIALYNEGATEHAVTSLRKALRFDRERDTYRLLGHLLLELERQDEAIDMIREGIEHFPDDAELHHIVGLALTIKRDPYPAAQAFTRAVELDPSNGDPLHSLGLCFESLGDVRRAIEAYERCLRLDCGDEVREDARKRMERLRILLER